MKKESGIRKTRRKIYQGFLERDAEDVVPYKKCFSYKLTYRKEATRWMVTILIQYGNREIPAILLARFNMVDNEFVSVRGFLGRIKDILTPLDRQYCLVFIPWKHKAKELSIVSVQDVITIDKLIGDDIVSVEKYISPFTEEDPYYAEYKISNFVGYKFVYEYKNFIANIRNQCFERTLEILYQHHPELLHKDFDEEKYTR